MKERGRTRSRGNERHWKKFEWGSSAKSGELACRKSVRQPGVIE